MRKCHVFDGAISFVFSFALLFSPTRGQNTPARCAISLPLNTRNYRPIAGWQYGLMFALCRYRSIRAHVRPMSLSLHTGSGAGYVLTFVARIRQRTRTEFAEFFDFWSV